MRTLRTMGLVLAAWPALALAQPNPMHYNPVIATIMTNTVNKGMMDAWARKVGNPRQLRDGGSTARPTARSSASLVVQRAASIGTAQELASFYPPGSRVETAQLFEQLLASYGDVERQLGLPPNDVGGAVTAFIVGSYGAYHNPPVDDAHFLQAVDQVRGWLLADAQFDRLSGRDRQEIYEKTATLGMLMAVTQIGLQQQPDAARERVMRDAGGQYLEAFLRVKPETVHIGPGGLSFR